MRQGLHKGVLNMATKAKKSSKKALSFREGSRKAKVYSTFRSRGEAAALKVGKQAKLKDSTLKTWVGSWKRAA